MTEILVYVVVGVFAGLLSGLLGVGGGVVLVPSFIWMFEYQNFPSSLSMHMAAGTSLSAMIVTTAVSFYTHWKHGVHFGSVLFELLPGLLLGTVFGAFLAHHLHGHLLRIFFGLLIFTIALSEYFRSEEVVSERKPDLFKMIAGSLGIGTTSGLIGVGGGTLMVPFLQRLHIPTRDAIGISTVGGFTIAVTGTLAFILLGLHVPHLPPHSLGYIYWPATLGVALGSPLFAILGAILSHRISVVLLKRIFSVFLIVIAIRLLHY